MRDRDVSIDSGFPSMAPSGAGGEALDSGHRGDWRITPTDEAMNEEADYESPEGDNELLRSGSPEFEHLIKPPQREHPAE